MKIYRKIEEFPTSSYGTMVTTGTFDGVHLGHQKMLKTMVQKSVSLGLETVLVTFDPHPRQVLAHHQATPLKFLNSLDEKIHFFAQNDIQHLIIQPFTLEFSKIPFTLYVRDYLIAKLNMKYMLVGHDHHVGKNRMGSYESLKELETLYDFKVDQVGAFELDGIQISSTKIRVALEEGDVQKALTFLGRPYHLKGMVVEGDKIGRTLGYPTANIKPIDVNKLIPANAIYAVQVTVRNQQFKGMASIGPRPTFQKEEPTIEIHILDFKGDIYNEWIDVDFIQKIRDIKKFNSPQELIQELDADKQKTLQIL